MKAARMAIAGVVIVILVTVAILTAASCPERSADKRRQEPPGDDRQDGRAVYSRSGHDITPLSQDRVEELAGKLTPAERRVLLGKGTERPFCGGLLHQNAQGAYTCRLCGLPLFSSGAKFDSGTGWPSFYMPVDPAHIHTEPDTSHGMTRTEIQCARCGSHLGHVFNDGPPPTGLRYCLNSIALEFHKISDLPEMSRGIETETAYFAGGCFWGIEDRFQQVPGVLDAVSGYMGGHTASPTYKEVCSGTTDHAETVRVTFDPKRVTYEQLLQWFFKFHDPTQENRQGPDVGTQYRSAIFAASDLQLDLAKRTIKALQATDRFGSRPIVTVVEKAGAFHEAEAYHQDYHRKHGGSCPIPRR